MDEGNINDAEEFRRRCDEFLTTAIVDAVLDAENTGQAAKTVTKPLENLHLDTKWSDVHPSSHEPE